MMKLALALVVTVAATLGSCMAQQNPVEIGKVKWTRDLDGALAKSKKSGKPVFLLFQEVPG